MTGTCDLGNGGLVQNDGTNPSAEMLSTDFRANYFNGPGL